MGAKARIHLFLDANKLDFLRMQASETGLTISELVERLIGHEITGKNSNWVDQVNLSDISVAEFFDRLKKVLTA